MVTDIMFFQERRRCTRRIGRIVKCRGFLGLFLACSYTAQGVMAFVPQAGTPGISGLAGSRGAFSQASRFERLSPGGSCVVPSTVGRITDRRCGWSGCGHRRGRCLGPVMSIPFLGQDTILGVGGFELAVCLVVGYFAVGPIELFKLVKQAGILAGQLKDIGLGTVTNLNQIMEEQVARAEDIASGKASPGEESYQVPYSEEDGEDEYEEVTVRGAMRFIFFAIHFLN
ncbi:unnamed protein product [Choristocarpus tenellus]